MAQILVFGDSITDGFYDEEGGWANRMQRFFMAENVEDGVIKEESNWFYNLGISGNTAEDLLKRIEVESLARKIDRPDKSKAVIFAIGTNDSTHEGSADVENYSLQEFQTNLYKLSDFVKKYTNKIMFVGLLPVDEKYTQPIYGTSWYDNQRIGMFDNAIEEVANKNDAVFVPVFKSMQEEPGWERYFIDGLHPNTEGHAWMYQRLKQPILELVKT